MEAKVANHYIKIDLKSLNKSLKSQRETSAQHQHNMTSLHPRKHKVLVGTTLFTALQECKAGFIKKDNVTIRR